MNPSLLRHKFQFYSLSNGVDAYGTAVKTEVLIAELKCQILSRKGAQTTSNDEVFFSDQMEIQSYYRKSVKAGHIAVYFDSKYMVKSVVPFVPENRMILTLEKQNVD